MEKIMSERLSMLSATAVSFWIGEYNKEVGSTEILPKSPAVIARSIESGEACLIRNGDCEPVAYGAIYPLIDENVAKNLGFLPVEIGDVSIDSFSKIKEFFDRLGQEEVYE